MSDFAARLRALAQDAATEHATGPGMPVDDLAARARGRRTRRTAGTVGVAAALVVVVAVGAGALGRSTREPVPAQTPTAAPTASVVPTPTPTPAVVLPTGDASRPFGACGSLVGSAPAFPVDDTLFVAHDDPPGTVEAGAPLEVVMSLGGDGGLARPAAGPRVVVTHEGVVVTSTDLYGGRRTDWVGQDGWLNVARHVGDVPLAVCDAPGATAGAPLPAGPYEVWFVGEASPTDAPFGEADVAVLADPAAGHRRSVVEGPFPLTVAGHADSVRMPPSSPLGTEVVYPSLPYSGDAAPTAPTGAGPWRFSHTSGPLEVAAADLVPRAEGQLLDDPGIDVSGTLTYGGPGRATLDADLVVLLWLVRDGRVVGTTHVPGDRYVGTVDMGPGHGVDLAPSSSPPVLCPPGEWECGSSGGTAVTPGEYTVIPGVLVHGGTVWTPQGGLQDVQDVVRNEPSDGSTQFLVLGEPVPLTVR